jgi:Tfp pilus assembly protein PilX
MMSPATSPGSRYRQSGVVLIAALIALVAMTLAGMALIRSMDTGLTIAGNMAFKSATTATSDVATDVGIKWLRDNSLPASNLHVDHAANSFYADWRTGCDMTGNETPTDKLDDMQWDPAGSVNPSCNAKATAATGLPDGYQGSYVITRMCTCAGSPGANVCSGSETNICAGLAGQTGFHGTALYTYRGLTGQEASLVATASPYYRVVTRVLGPRNTVSFVESVVTLE